MAGQLHCIPGMPRGVTSSRSRGGVRAGRSFSEGSDAGRRCVVWDGQALGWKACRAGTAGQGGGGVGAGWSGRGRLNAGLY
jgi:hypothetical protein